MTVLMMNASRNDNYRRAMALYRWIASSHFDWTKNEIIHVPRNDSTKENAPRNDKNPESLHSLGRSVLFGASSKEHIRESKELIEANL